MSEPSQNSISRNRLLARLSTEEHQRLLPHFELLQMGLNVSVYEPHKTIEYVYFPLTGLASMLAVMDDGALVEVGTVGNEGMVGVPVFLGKDRTSILSFWQVPGEAVRMKAEAFRAEIENG